MRFFLANPNAVPGWNGRKWSGMFVVFRRWPDLPRSEHPVEMSLSVPQSHGPFLGLEIAPFYMLTSQVQGPRSTHLIEFSRHLGWDAARQWHTTRRHSTDLVEFRKMTADRGSVISPTLSRSVRDATVSREAVISRSRSFGRKVSLVRSAKRLNHRFDGAQIS